MGMKLLTTIGSNSMVTSVPPPSTTSTAALTMSDQLRYLPSTASYNESERPVYGSGSYGMGFGSGSVSGLGSVRLGVADVEMRGGGDIRTQTQSTDDLAGLLNRRSVTFQGDRTAEPVRTGSQGPAVGQRTGGGGGGETGEGSSGHGQRFMSGDSPYIETMEDEIEDPGPDPPSYLNPNSFSYNNPLPINMFQPYGASTNGPPVPPPVPPYMESSRVNSQSNYLGDTGITMSLEERMRQNTNRAGFVPKDTAKKQFNSSSNNTTSWPHELPMTAPSPDELYAQLAMISSAADRRAALVNVKAKASTKNQNQKSGGTAAVRRVSPNEPALTRIEQGTARLNKQFETLQKEILNLSKESRHPSPRNSDPRNSESRSSSRPHGTGRSMIPFRSGSSVQSSPSRRATGGDRAGDPGSRGRGQTSRKSRDIGVNNRGGKENSRERGEYEDNSVDGLRREYPGDEGMGYERERGDSGGRYGDRENDRERDRERETERLAAMHYGESRWGSQALETMAKIVDTGVILSHRVRGSITHSVCLCMSSMSVSYESFLLIL
jgi:hypothetical protein